MAKHLVRARAYYGNRVIEPGETIEWPDDVKLPSWLQAPPAEPVVPAAKPRGRPAKAAKDADAPKEPAEKEPAAPSDPGPMPAGLVRDWQA